ncbi:hypothetical protein ACMDMY_005111 [Salmonella enterica]|nr:hypothetical protein [Salmonella enterica]
MSGHFLYRVAPGNSAYFLTNPSSDESKHRNWLFFVPCCPGQQRLFFNQFTIRRTKTSQLVIFRTMLPPGSSAYFLTNSPSGEPKRHNWLFFVPCCPGQQRLFFNQFTIRRTKTSHLVIFCTVLPRATALIF